MPAVLVCTDAFLALARTAAALAGRPDLSLVTVPHPVAGLMPAAVEALAAGLVDGVAARLIGSPP